MNDLIAHCTAPHCALPALAFVCRSHADQLAAALATVADLAVDLDITIARQAATGQRIGGRCAERPLPYHDAASEVRRDLHATLATWTRDLWETNGPRREVPTGETAPDGTPQTVAVLEPLDLADTLPEIAAWLLRHPSWIAWHPAAGELIDELLDAIARAWRVVDLPPELAYCGPCSDCETDLYARPQRDVVTCRECATVHEVADRRATMLKAARGRMLTAAECARALPGLLGRELSANTLRTWAHSGKLRQYKPRHGDPRNRPRYLVGEVIDLATATPQRRTAAAS
ncbi:hypothetical protein AB0L88_03070 [Saccharopolyspora shandongensis]|uniref:hypothetical protein n=1 Tax=Saccharopolyspora shandongensis TaxID=418495 RepID=UPI00343E68AF